MEEDKEINKEENNVVENENQKKNKTVLIICIIAVIVLLIGVALLLFKGSGDEGEKENEPPKDEKLTRIDGKDTKDRFTEITDILDNVYYDGKKIDIGLGDGNGDLGIYEVNGKKIFEHNGINDLGKVYIIDDLLVLLESGYYQGGGNLYFVNINGDILKIIGRSAEDTLGIFKLDNNTTYLSLIMSRATDGDCFGISVNGEVTDVCVCDDLDKYNVSDDYVLELGYNIYYKNGELEIEVIPNSEITVKEYNEKYCTGESEVDKLTKIDGKDTKDKYTEITDILDNVYYDGQKVNIETKEGQEYPGNDYYVNGNKIFSDVGFLEVDKVYIMDDLIVFWLLGSSGASAVYFVNVDGTILKTSDLDELPLIWGFGVEDNAVFISTGAISDGGCDRDDFDDDDIVTIDYKVYYNNATIRIEKIKEETFKQMCENE